MKRVRDILLAVVAVMIVVACGESRHISDTHKQAEAVMQEHPDSALTLLQAINPDDLTTDRGRAMHALLLSQAYDKNYIDLTDDSLISIAVDYFAPTNDHHYAMLAHYYHGRVLFNANKLAESSVSLIKAENHALKIKDDFYLGMIYAWQAYVYNYSYNFEEELICAQKSLEHFQKYGNEKYIGNALISLAEGYNNTYKFPESIRAFDEAIEFGLQHNDSVLIGYSLLKRAHVNMHINDFATAKGNIITAITKYNQAIDGVACGNLAKIYSVEAKFDSALYYLQLGERIMVSVLDSSSVAKGWTEYYLQQNEETKAIKKINERRRIQDKTTIQVWQQAVVKSQRDYLNVKNEKVLAEKQSQKLRFLLVIIALGVVVLYAIFYSIQAKLRSRLQSERLKNVMNERDYLENQVLAIRSKIDIAEKELNQEKGEKQIIADELVVLQNTLSLYEKQIQIQKEHRKKAEETIASSVILQKLYDIANSNKNADEKIWTELNDFIISQYPQFKINIYSLYHISEIEYRVCMLIKCQIPPTDISRLINRSKESVSSIRRRLYYKLLNKKGSPQDFDQFILSL